MPAGTAREQALFEAALAIEGAVQRKKFLEEACAGDERLKSQIEELLAAHAKSDRFFSPAVADFIKQAARPLAANFEHAAGEKIGSRIGRYLILQKLGEGGCGTVYLAEQQEPVRRRVALKLIKFGMDSRNVIARFEAERQALALMDHPNIAKVLDAGSTAGGRPFCVLEFVHGVRITNYCDENHVGTPQRLQLFIQVCHALQHAHQKGVIHRDIKPSNILVTVSNEVPAPKVIDFGIAKSTEGKLTDSARITACGQFIGTPAYMSPEQAEMGGVDVDQRSDIYSLGVLLYELLTGRTPIDQQELLNSGFDEMRRTLREDEPPSPSTMLTSLAHAELTATAKHRHVDPPRLISTLKGDLDWIVLKALEKDRERRYQTANGLAMDVQRYLNNEPVIARPPSQLYRFKKMVRRNQVIFVSGTVVALTLIAGLGISTHLYFREREALQVQERLRQEADQARLESEAARANEMRLRQMAEAREKITQARVLELHGSMPEADALLAQVPANLFSPSIEATTTFRELGVWNLMQGNPKAAADRYSVLLQVDQVDKSDQTDEATRDFLMATPLLIEAGDLVGYDRIRHMELERLADTTNLIAAEQVVKTSLLLPADQSVMRKLVPLGKTLAASLDSPDPNINGGSHFASWRAIALALLEYRQGHFTNTLHWLDQCSTYTVQAPSCAATAHVFRSLAWSQLGEQHEAEAELKMGKQMVEQLFKQKLEWGDNQSGQLPGWLTARIFLREAENLRTVAAAQ